MLLNLVNDVIFSKCSCQFLWYVAKSCIRGHNMYLNMNYAPFYWNCVIVTKNRTLRSSNALQLSVQASVPPAENGVN